MVILDGLVSMLTSKIIPDNSLGVIDLNLGSRVAAAYGCLLNGIIQIVISIRITNTSPYTLGVQDRCNEIDLQKRLP